MDGDGKAYKAENSWNTELGWRTALFDNTVDFSCAIYYISTKDIQLYTGNIPNQVLGNHGDAESQGIELNAFWYPTDELTVNLGSTFGKSEFKDGTIAGNRLTYAPDTTATVGLDYQFAQPVFGGDLSLQANARYNSKMYFDEKNTLSQDAVTLVNLSSEWKYGDFNYRIFVNNLTDKTYKTYAFASGNSYGDRREFGVAVSMDI